MALFRITKLASGGLYLSGPDDRLPEGFMRRYRGVSTLAQNSIISRDGSDLLYSLNAHSLVYFASNWYSGVSTSFYRAAAAIRTGLSGDRLSFATTAPVAGLPDYLFVAGGGELFKVDSNGNDTNWGIAPPGSSPALADGGAGGALTTGAVYQYAVTFLCSETGHRSNPNASDDTAAITSDFKLLLHFEGTEGSTTITDSSPSARSGTLTGDAYITNTDYKLGAGCLFFDTSLNGYVYWADSDDFALTADFTIEGWFRLGGSDSGILQQRVDDNNIVLLDCEYSTVGKFSQRPRFLIKSSASTIIELNGLIASDLFGWHHISINRASNTWYLFVNGNLNDSETNANSYPNLAAQFELGRVNYGGSTTYMQASSKVDEFVIVKGTALRTSSFVPPQSPFGTDGIDLGGSSNSVDLTDIPVSTDDQVDYVEIWRTIGDGDVLFWLTSLPNGTTTWTDDLADSTLLSLELPLDNIKPYSWFDDCYGPWNGSMFWITRSEEGERGRVYYSAIGRAEAMQGFIEVTSDDDGLQRITSYAGQLFVLSKSKAFQVYGTNPYYSREIAGVPGTIAPHTLKITPFGPMWESQDGVRFFTGGAQAQLVAYEQVAPIFRGRAVGNFAAFTGVVATFARGEYIISNGTSTLAFSLETKRWRDLGVGCNALAYSPEADQIAATVSSTILDLEKEGETDDNGTGISLDLLTNEFNPGIPFGVELIRIEANANGETIAAAAYINGSSSSLGNLTTTAGRRFTEFDLDARIMDRLSTRLSGTLSDSIEIFEIQIQYWPVVLYLQVGPPSKDNPIMQIPGRLAGDRQTLTFEAFEDTQFPLGVVYIFERLFYDIDANSNSISFTLYLIGESSVSLGSISGAARAVDEINITKKGRFDKLVLAGDFTKAIAFRRLSLIAQAKPAR
jgi:hypothetical protein